jgi:hypothetical protein
MFVRRASLPAWPRMKCSGAQVAIQQRVTGSILLTFSTDVTSTQRKTIQLQYEPKRQVRISVLRDEYGGYGMDVRLHKVF